MTLKTAALMALLAELASLALGFVNLVTSLPLYGERPILLLTVGVGMLAQASLATFFLVFYTRFGPAS